MSPIIKNIIASVLIAVIGYFAVTEMTVGISNGFALAAGILFGGILIPIITGYINSDHASVSDDDDDSKTLYIGNLPYRANEQAVRDHFASYTQVFSVRLMKDRRTGKRKGYGFVEVAAASAEGVIRKLNDTDFQERTLKVRMAKDKVDEE